MEMLGGEWISASKIELTIVKSSVEMTALWRNIYKVRKSVGICKMSVVSLLQDLVLDKGKDVEKMSG
jgi:hypothetical protein